MARKVFPFVNSNGYDASFVPFSAVAADDAGFERERKELDERFGQLRPEVLETLRESMRHTIVMVYI